MKYNSNKKGAEIDNGIILRVSKDFTAQDIMSWYPNPIVLVEGIPDSFIIPIQFVFEHTRGSQPFLNGNNFGVYYLKQSGQVSASVPFELVPGSAFQAPEDYSQISFAKNMFSLSSEIPRGMRVAFGHQTGSAFTNGNGSAKLTLWYTIK